MPELFAAARARRRSAAEESRVLAEALSGDRSVVVSAAGGVVLSEANRQLLRALGDRGLAASGRGHPGRRVGAGEGRPLLDADPAAALAALDRCAAPSTRTSPTRWWTSTSSGPSEVADRVLAALAGDHGGER